MTEPTEAEGSRRGATRPGSPDRRRTGWKEFRRTYPGFVTTLGLALLLMLSLDAWLIVRRIRYASEIARLRAGMTDVERKRADAVMNSEQNKTAVTLELLRRQALGEAALHLSVSLDSGTMYLEQAGASLRDMSVEVGPERTVGTPPDTVHMSAPRGVRTVIRVLGADEPWEIPAWVFHDRQLDTPAARTIGGSLGPSAIVLDGGTVIYSRPKTGPLADSVYVMPGSVRARATDLNAIAPNLRPGIKVYFY